MNEDQLKWKKMIVDKSELNLISADKEITITRLTRCCFNSRFLTTILNSVSCVWCLTHIQICNHFILLPAFFVPDRMTGV